MITDNIVYTDTRVWKLDHARGGVGGGRCVVGPKETAIWEKAIEWGHLCTLDTLVSFSDGTRKIIK